MRSTTPATTETHGPFRRVVRVVEVEAGEMSVKQVDGTYKALPRAAYRQEVLACGHNGKRLNRGIGSRKQRRCLLCTSESLPQPNLPSKTYKQLCDEANRADGEPLWDQGEMEADRREDHEQWVRAGKPWR